MIHNTNEVTAAIIPKRGMMLTHAQMHIATPIGCAGVCSETAIPRLANSFANDFAMENTTKNCQTRLNNGINRSQTIPGSIVLAVAAHLLNAFWSVKR